MAKRSHGEGTIYQRSDGRWQAQVTVDGKRLSRTHKDRKVVDAWRRSMAAQVQRGLTYDGARITLADYLTRWLAGVESSVRPTTLAGYSIAVNNHLIPQLGDVLIKDLSPDRIQYAYDSLLAAGVGVYTVIKCHTVLRTALERAARSGLAFRNAAALVSPPAAPHKEMLFWSETEATHFLTAAQGHRLYGLFYLAIVTGMRQAEICGLQWPDLEWTRRTLHIRRKTNRTGEMFGPLKTAASRRTITLGAGAIDVLHKHQAAQDFERRVAGDSWREHGLIFTSTIGTPVHYKNLSDRDFRPLIAAAGVPVIRYHDLRHTAASIMLGHGLPVIVVSKILGHARVSITQDIYGHLLPGLDAGAIEMVEDLVTPVALDLPVSL